MNEVRMRSSNSNNFININKSTSKAPMTTIDSIKMKLLIDSQNDNELHGLKHASNEIQKVKLRVKNEKQGSDNDFDQKKGKLLKRQKVKKASDVQTKHLSGEMNDTNRSTSQKKLRFSSRSKFNNSQTKNSEPPIYTNQTFARTRSSFGISVDQPILLDSSSDSDDDPNRFFGKKRRLSNNDKNYDKYTSNEKLSKEHKVRTSSITNSKIAEVKVSPSKQKVKDNISNKHNKKLINKGVPKQLPITQLKKDDLSKQAPSIKSIKKSSKLSDEEKLPMELRDNKNSIGKPVNMILKKNDSNAESHNKNYEKETQNMSKNNHLREEKIKAEDEKKPISKKNLNESLQNLGKIPRKSKIGSQKLASSLSSVLDSITKESNELTRKSKRKGTRSQSSKVDIKIEQNGKIEKKFQNLYDDKKKETINNMESDDVIKGSNPLPKRNSAVPPIRTLKNSFSTCCISCSKSKREDFCNRKKPCDICIGKKLRHCTYPSDRIVPQQSNKGDSKLLEKTNFGFKSKKEGKGRKKLKLSEQLSSGMAHLPHLSYSDNKENNVSEADDESKSESELYSDSDSEDSGAESESKVFAQTKRSKLKNSSSFHGIYKSDGDDEDNEHDEQEEGDDVTYECSVSVDNNDEYNDRKLSERLARREGSLKAQRILQELEFDSRDLTGMFNNSRSRRNATKENYYVPSDEEDENSSAIAYEEAAARNECLILSEDEQERRMLRGNISKDFLESVRQERDRHITHHNAHDSVSSDSDYE